MKLRCGDYVEVRSREEILATLDSNGCLDGMPFMPEMLQFCGRKLRVWKVAHKTCDTATKSGGRRVENAVHLEGTRCDGAAHGGCQARCNLFWNVAWLRPLREVGRPARSVHRGQGCTEERLREVTRKTAPGKQPVVYRCQATQILDYTRPLAWWDLRQYVRDVVSGNVPARQVIRGLVLSWFAAWKQFGFPWRISQTAYERVHKLLTKRESPLRNGCIGPGQPTPTGMFGLQPGDWVRVKPHAEIRQTLNVFNRNRGLLFDPELAYYCGKEYRISHRVERIIDEGTGQMIEMKSPCLVLDGAICRGEYTQRRMFCPRAHLPYWREIWLEKVEQPKVLRANPPPRSAVEECASIEPALRP